MSDQTPVPLADADQSGAYATLLSAFTDDPVERWLYPELAQYLTAFPAFLAAFGGRAFDQRTAWGLDGVSAVALWLPPGVQADGDAVVHVLSATVASDLHTDMFDVLGQMEAAHPTYPHWYLAWLGVDAAMQGHGLGGRLLAWCLDLVDESHLPAYLETPNPRTISLYRRHGFELTGHAAAGACPPVSFMLRSAR